MARSLDTRLGQILVQKKRCSLREVNSALMRLRRMRANSQSVPLGKLLVDEGLIDEETLWETLADLGTLRLRCKNCSAEQPTESYSRGSALACFECGGSLELQDAGDTDSASRTNGRSRSSSESVEESGDLGSRSAGQSSDPSSSSAPSSAPSRINLHVGGTDVSTPSELEGHDTFIGRVLGGCKLTSKIAHGGMGVVYKATQLTLGRVVAVKVLSEELAKDTNFVRRFLQEARSAAHLNHGNIVHINDVGEQDGVFYFVMEFVDGQNLKDVLKTRRMLPIDRALEITLQVCHALRHAHSRSVIHRDIKPENIMITRDGIVKLADLGLAKRMDSESSASGITHAGSILGTPFYMAPEQAKDFSRVDTRSDIYSLGVTLYKMITGRVPFQGRSPIEVMIKAIDGRKVRMSELRDDVSEDVEKVVDKMMSRRPADRYQNVVDVVPELERLIRAETKKLPGQASDSGS